MTTALAPAPTKLANQRRSSNKRAIQQGSTVGNIAAGVGAWIIGLLFISPIIWMLLTSLHTEQDAAANPPAFAAPLTFENYSNFFAGGQAIYPILNSVIASFSSTLLVILLAIPAAYALSVRPVEKWTDVMFFFLTTKMLPLVAGILPIYLIAKQFNLLDNINLLVILYTGMNLPIAIWMMRSFLADIPVELFEAAAIDGAGLITTLRSVIVPIISPGIAATALICFIFSWNELFLANRLASGVVARTAPVFLGSFITGEGLFAAKLAAAAVIVSLPVLIAGFAAQDKLVQGLSLGAVK